MFDTHYDLLSICLLDKHFQSDYVKKHHSDFRKNNITGVFANLYFMKKKQMVKEWHIRSKTPNVTVLFKESLQLLEKQKLPIDVLYSIEGCDYIKDEKELEQLHKEGLDSILPVWNHANCYGGGAASHKGLTKKGVRLIQKAIDLGMGIDLSHTNQKTFKEIIAIIKQAEEQGKKVHCYVSHSNSYALAKHRRNVTDEQLQAIKLVHGYVGVVMYPPFLGNKTYIEHLKHIIKIIGIDYVMIASDDMGFLSIYDKKQALKKQGIYPHHQLKHNLEKELLQNFSKEDTQKILQINAKRLYNEIKGD